MIRLLIDIARKCGFTLYIGIIDYQKAYDKVNRWVLLDRLYKKGCGTIFLMAISAALVGSIGLIGSLFFETSAGVRQGASTSCPLFVFFIDATVEAVNSFGPDGWLGVIHMLLLMDDTVIFATSKANLEAKLRLLKDSADRLGMVIHPTKSKFLCVNSDDKSPIFIDSVKMSYTEIYLYLGSWISTENIATQVKHHFRDKYCQVAKFYMFLYKNSDVPYHIKKSVWDSAVKSSLFYGAEAWLTKDLAVAESTYLATVKRMLGVRATTTTDIILLEAGLPPPKAYIQQLQFKFIHKLSTRDNFYDSYIGKAVTMAINHKTEAGKLLKFYLNTSPDHDFCATAMVKLQTSVQASASPRRESYKLMNPSLSVNFVYTSQSLIPEFQRIAFTRLRLMSHRLKIETGRWTRPVTPRENRLCECKAIQSEEHVLLKCPLTAHLRTPHLEQISDIASLFELSTESAFQVSKLCYDAMNVFI